jgi:hypothetical protein
MSIVTLSNDCFDFSTLDPTSVELAFLAHLKRFESQNRDVSWEGAPAAFAGVCGEADELTTNLFRVAMEDLFDAGAIRVERLPDRSNRLRTA